MTKTWLITGGSRGLGRALCEAVLRAGDNLVAPARNIGSLGNLSDRYGEQIVLRPSTSRTPPRRKQPWLPLSSAEEERKFIDLSRSPLFFGEEKIIFG